MYKMIFVLLALTSYYTKTNSPDQSFMSAIRYQAGMDSSHTTSIEIIPKRQVFRKIKPGGTIDGVFTIKNTGPHAFFVGSIASNCDCIETNYPVDTIAMGDGMQVFFKMICIFPLEWHLQDLV